MRKQGFISVYQISSIMFLCRMMSLFTFMLPTTAFLQSGDRILAVIPLIAIELFYALFTVYILKKNENQSIVTQAKNCSAVGGKILSVIYILYFVWFAGLSLSRFELFISTAVFPNSELYLMTVILLAAAFYAALKGLEAIGRAAVIISAILGVSIIFILFTVSGDFRFYNLKPILTDGIMPILNFSFYVSSRTVETVALQINAPKINGNLKKTVLLWTPLVGILSAVIFLVLAGVTGEYGDDQIFPFYTLTVIARFGIFERLDDILTGTWVLCSFIQLTFLILTAFISAEQGFNKAKKIPVCLTVTAGIFTVYLFTSKTVTSYSEILSSRVQDVIFILILLVFPAAVTLLNRIKRRKKV